MATGSKFQSYSVGSYPLPRWLSLIANQPVCAWQAMAALT